MNMPTVNYFGVPVTLLSSLQDDNGRVAVTFDMVDQVDVVEESVITRHPIESGSNVTDHVLNLPVKIAISGRFVDSPLSVGGATFFNPVAAITSAVQSGLKGGLSVQKWNTLEILRRNKVPLLLSIQQGAYPNMFIESLTAPRMKGDGTSMRFRIELQEVVTTQLIGILAGNARADVDPTASPIQDLGNVSPSAFGP